VVDQFSGSLLGTNWSLADREPSYFLIGTQVLPNGNVSTFDSSYQESNLVADDPASPTPNYTQFDYRFDANIWPFTPLWNPANPSESLSDPRRIDMVSLGGCAAPLSGCRDPFPIQGKWFSIIEDSNSSTGGGGYADGFFTTSLRETFPEVPEPSAQVLEVLSGLVLLSGVLYSRWMKKVHA
jgi:hypothetical protein